MATDTVREADEAAEVVDRSPWWQVGLRTLKTYSAHGMTDHAAGLTYYAMMSIFPGLLTAVSLLGIFGQASLATDAADYVVKNGASSDTAGVIQDSLTTLFESNSGAVGVALVISILLGLNGASGAFGAAGRALNVVHAVDEDRGFVRRKVTDVGSTLIVIVLFGVALVCIALGGGIADDLLGTIGLGSVGKTVWGIARWPVAIGVMMVAFSVIYALAPDVEPRRMRWISPGAIAAVLIWIIASLAFALYLTNFSSYGAAYGAFGAAIALLLWLYISANAFLLGGELNVAIEREETAGRGGPPMVTPPPSPDNPVPGVAPRAATDPNENLTSGGPGAKG